MSEFGDIIWKGRGKSKKRKSVQNVNDKKESNRNDNVVKEIGKYLRVLNGCVWSVKDSKNMIVNERNVSVLKKNVL